MVFHSQCMLHLPCEASESPEALDEELEFLSQGEGWTEIWDSGNFGNMYVNDGDTHIPIYIYTYSLLFKVLYSLV